MRALCVCLWLCWFVREWYWFVIVVVGRLTWIGELESIAVDKIVTVVGELGIIANLTSSFDPQSSSSLLAVCRDSRVSYIVN